MGIIHRKYTNSANYINLNYNPQSNPKVETKIILGEHVYSQSENGVFGIYQSYNDSKSIALNINRTRQNFSYYVGGVFKDYAGTAVSGETYIIELSTTAFTINGVTTPYSANYQTSNNPFIIGGVSRSGSYLDEAIRDFSMEYIRIYEGDTLKYNLIAAKNNDGYGCLKDTLTNTIYDFTNPSDIEYIAYFEPSKSSFNFSSTGGTDTFEITSNTGWTATTASDCVSVSPMTGTTGGTITLTCNQNTGTARTATITFTNADSDTFDITVQQKAQGLILPIAKMKKSGNTISKEYHYGSE